MSEKSYTPGRVVWRELMTRDVAKARAFYGELFGWRFEEVDMGPMGKYTMVHAGAKPIGGLWPKPEGDPRPSAWMSYVSVEDVDQASEQAKAQGGQIMYGPADIPNVGRFALLSDPGGAVFLAFRSAEGDPPAGMPGLHEFCWETISAPDVAQAEGFYDHLFGWKSMPSPAPGGKVFSVDGTPQGMVADVYPAKAEVPPHWLTYVAVEKLETSTERAAKLGAQVPMPKIEIPNIGYSAFVVDPEGAALGLFQPLVQG